MPCHTISFHLPTETKEEKEHHLLDRIVDEYYTHYDMMFWALESRILLGEMIISDQRMEQPVSRHHHSHAVAV